MTWLNQTLESLLTTVKGKDMPIGDRASSWFPLPQTLILETNEVHISRASLNVAATCVQCLKKTLSTDELTRAERYHFKRDRDHFIVARGLLRILLGRYLDMEPSQLRFCYTSEGKPSLANRTPDDALRFNVSSSQELVLYGVTRGRELGVDIEFISPALPGQQIAERFFSPQEVAMLRALPVHLREEAFFTCWTRKEAYVKARGRGLSLPLDRFAVSVSPDEPAALLNTGSESEGASSWSLKTLNVGTGYAACLAVKGDAWVLRCWQLQGEFCLNRRCEIISHELDSGESVLTEEPTKGLDLV
jgi:4'-phosphopantetheinyl transferase